MACSSNSRQQGQLLSLHIWAQMSSKGQASEPGRVAVFLRKEFAADCCNQEHY